MVFGIVEQHGGHIEVRSAPGDGTTFRIALPLVDASARAASRRLPGAGLPEPPRPLRVLVVDDEPMMTKAVMRMLKPSGHLVSVASVGRRGAGQAGRADVRRGGLGHGHGRRHERVGAGG